MLQPATMSEPIHISEFFSSIQGEGLLAGRRQLFIRLTDCNMECRYCDTNHQRGDACHLETTPGGGVFSDITQPLSLSKVIDIVTRWRDILPGAHHSISITGGEPLIHSDTLKEWLPSLRRLFPIHLETNGTMHFALEQVISEIDYVSMDMKLTSTSGCTEHLWDLHRDFLAVANGHNASVKVVVGEETTDEEISQTCNIILSVDPATPLFIQPLTGSDGKVDISACRLLAIQGIASAYLPDVRVIPQFHRMLGVA